MTHKGIIKKVINWAQKEFPELIFEKEKVYKINPTLSGGISKPYFRVDIIGKDSSGKEKIGIECKTKKDHNTFRKLAAAIGQGYVLGKTFGKSYIALEVDYSFKNKAKLSRYAWLRNIRKELGIGFLLVGKKVVKIEEAQKIKPVANTLFIRMNRNF